MSPQTLHHSLLAPAILHILRAAGFHSTRPSVLDTLTDLCARYMLLIASRVADYANNRAVLSPEDIASLSPPDDTTRLASHDDTTRLASHDDGALTTISSLDHATPDVSDLRQALTSVAFFASSLTATEEAWQEILRKPLDSLPLAVRDKERSRRDLEDTKDVREFIDWITGPVHKEIRRIAGLLPDEPMAHGMVGIGAPAAGAVLAELSNMEKTDYLTTLKKKHSKTADGTRFSGTALGKLGEDRGLIRIEGGPSLEEVRLKRRVVERDNEPLEGNAKRIAT